MTLRALEGVTTLVALALLAAFALAPAALADATPVELVLTYMPNVSNTGTPAASGIAELVMPEGEVRISAADLPHLDGEARYVAWVLNTQTNEYLRLGAFNTDESNSSVHYETVLPDAIPNKHWNLLLLTVEAGAEPAKPSQKHSLAGTFPRADSEPPPALLPNTGGAPDDLPVSSRADWLPVAGLVALGSVLGFGAGYGAGVSRKS
jgi:hypothetical protein